MSRHDFSVGLGPPRPLLPARASDEEEPLSRNELVSTLVFLLIAGRETAVHIIGNGMAALLCNPGQYHLLRNNPDFVVNAVEKFLRYDRPLERATIRFAAEDIEIAGTTIPKGSFIHVSVGAANRDPAAFEEPDRLDTTRNANRHPGFGNGIRFCLGAPLARLEGHTAFETLMRRLPDLALAVPPTELDWLITRSTTRGLDVLPVQAARYAVKAPPPTCEETTP